MKDETRSGGAQMMPAGARFHDEMAAQWSAGYERPGFRRRLDRFRTILTQNVLVGESWLDLGCGSGVLTAELLALGADVVAVDASPAMLAAARETVRVPSGQLVRWIQTDATDLKGIPSSSVDGVLCSSVIEYVYEPGSVLSECARVLRDGGKLIVSVPAKGSMVRLGQQMIRRLAKLTGRDIFRYLEVSRLELQPQALRSRLLQAGFRVISTVGFDPILPAVFIRVIPPSLLIAEARKGSGRPS
jgi:ubiquinone/menaquinone biosynthesis C-methylase UbiE